MRWITASVATLAFAVTSCQNAQVATKRSKAEEEKEKSILDETKTTSSSFTDTINDGRKVEFATWSDVYSKIDFTRLHPKTQLFYQVSSP